MNTDLREKALQGAPLTDVLIVDFHVHLGGWCRNDFLVTPEKILALMEGTGVDRICVNGALLPDVRQANNAVADLAKRFPNKAIPIATLNPYQGNMADEIKRCIHELGMRGLKVHVLHKGKYAEPLRRPGDPWDKVWEQCAKHKLPVLYHEVVTDDDIRSHPDTVFVKAHGLGDVRHAHRMRLCRNFYVDTAASQNTAWNLQKMVEILGADRILWASDAPFADFAQRLGVVLDSGLSLDDQKDILGRNAARLLGIRE